VKWFVKGLNGKGNRRKIRLYQSLEKRPRTEGGAKEKSHLLAVDFSAVGVILVLRFSVVRTMRKSFQAGA
jgi:hypothetical protein